MSSEPGIWFNPLDPHFKETQEQIHNQIRSVVPPAEIRYYEGNLYLSDTGIDVLLEACESDQLPNGTDTG